MVAVARRRGQKRYSTTAASPATTTSRRTAASITRASGAPASISTPFASGSLESKGAEAAYKLVRVQRYFELPGDHWRGWHFAAGKLWSPEGHGFEPQDSNWWALLVRQARSFKNLYQRQAAFDVVLRGLGADRAAAPTASVARRSDARTEPQSGGTPGQREALSLDLSLGHFGTQRLEKPVLQRENRKTVGPSIKSASTNLDGVHDGR